MHSHRVPDDVARAVRARWPDVAPTWLANLATELDDLCGRYDARPMQVFAARYSYVVEVARPGGEPLIMRSTVDPSGQFQAQAAELLGGAGVGPVVHEVRTIGSSTWMVVDRIRPGTSAEVGTNPAELASLLRPLVATQPRAIGLPRLTDWLDQRLTTGGVGDIAPGYSPAQATELANARALLAELKTDEPGGLCHGDCSRGNVLRARSGFMLIDPRGVCGDLAYDAAVMAFKTGNNPVELAERLGLDPSRTEAWTTVAVAARV